MPFLLLLTAALPFAVADLRTGEQPMVQMSSGLAVPMRVVSIDETRDGAQSAVREARVSAIVDGIKIELCCANYERPRGAGRVQVDCPVTAAYLRNSAEDH